MRVLIPYLLTAASFFLVFMGGGCASLTPTPDQITADTAKDLLAAIQGHQEEKSLALLDSIQPPLRRPLNSNDEHTLKRILESAADQGAACPQRLVARLVDQGASLSDSSRAKDMKQKIPRWLSCPGLLAAVYAKAQPKQKMVFAQVILEAMPRQIEAGSLVLRKAVIMENRDLGDRILEVTREQLEEYGRVFQSVLQDAELQCARSDNGFCDLKDEAVKMRTWFRAEAERKRGLVLQGQLDAKAQAAFLEMVDSVYGPLLDSPRATEPKSLPHAL